MPTCHLCLPTLPDLPPTLTWLQLHPYRLPLPTICLYQVHISSLQHLTLRRRAVSFGMLGEINDFVQSQIYHHSVTNWSWQP